MSTTILNLGRDGAALYSQLAHDVLPALEAILGDYSSKRPGHRLTGMTALLPILGQSGAIGRVAHAALGPGSTPVRAVLFDKTRETNWALAWHQDRTVVVKARHAVSGFSAWTVKQGEQHVAPPFSLLARMVTIRIHLDDVPASNAPLLIALGSHRAGLVPVQHIAQTVRQHRQYACTAQAGDVWLYATPILHASDRATIPTRRRVLQVDYSADALPGGLEWLGLDAKQ